MSKYTTEIRFICENASGLSESVGVKSVNEVIRKALPVIFDFDFPIFDENYRNVLETKILKHYYTREIGEETVGLWKLRLETRLNEIMPYYNQLYKSELLTFNPFYDVDLTREHSSTKKGTKTDTGESTGNRTTIETGSLTNSGTETTTSTDKGTSKTTETGTTSNKNNEYYSDTPQGSVGNLENLTYLTNATINNFSGQNSNTSNGENSNTNNGETITNVNRDTVNNNTVDTTDTTSYNSVINDTEDYLESVKGKQGSTSYSKLLEEYRTTFLNIDLQVINELSDLFMNLW